MTPIPSIRKHLLTMVCLLSLSAGVFAADGSTITGNLIVNEKTTINEKLLKSFKQTFPNAQEVKWLEQQDKYTVNFKENGILNKIDYDKDGNFLSSIRYYSEKNLPVNILVKLQKKYPGKKIFGVTEMNADSNLDYYIKLEDEKSWMTIKSDSDANLQVTEKYNKAS
jgi:hypothetical protein